MTEKERLDRVLHHQPTDRPPCICPGGMMNMITVDLMEAVSIEWPEAHINAEMMAELAVASYEKGCFENVGVPFCMTIEAEELGAEVTIGSQIFEPHVTGYCISSVTEWESLSKIDISRGRAKVVLEAIRILKEKKLDVPIIGNITGSISTANSVVEPVQFYKELRKKPEEAHKCLDFVTEQLVVLAKAMIEAGADVIAISDPSGTGEILGPKLFEQYTVKYLNMLLDKLQGVGTIVHICGQMRSVYKQISQVTADALSFDAVVSMREAKNNLPGRVIMGNISTYALEFGDEERIKKLTKFCLNSGVDIISPACGLGTKSPLANIQAILKTMKLENMEEIEDISSLKEEEM